MKFAQFQSTYKPLPIATFEKTGEELEAKYYKNRENSSLIRQGLANAKVEDRNVGHLAKITTDVEQMLDSVNGEWQYAANTLYNIKDRITNDKALNASLEDYKKSQAGKLEQQKRLEEGKIGQDALNAYYTYEKIYNSKGIEVDGNGQLKNRWVTPTAPDKPDTDAQAVKMVDMLLKNPDSVDSGLRTILNKEGLNSGYLERIRTEGVTDDKIFSVIKGWLANSDDVKDYYNYINKADLLSKTSEILPDGNIAQKSILPSLVSEYRNLGWNVDANGKLLDNYQHYINGRGEFDIAKDKNGKSIVLQDAPANILESANVKVLINEGKLSVEDALKQTYLSHKLNSQLNGIADNYKDYAFQKTISTETIRDEEHWLKTKMEQERLQNANIQFGNTDKVPMGSTTPYSVRDAETLSKQLQERFTNMKPDHPEYQSTKQALEEQTQNIVTLSKSFLSSTEGKAVVAEEWRKLVKGLPVNEQITAYEMHYNSFLNYMQGTGTLPANFTLGNETNSKSIPADPKLLDNVNRNFSGYGTTSIGRLGDAVYLGDTPLRNSLTFKLGDAKINFQKELDKKIKSGLAIDNNYRIFRDKEGNLSNFHKAQGEYIKTNGDSYVLPYSLTKQGEPVKMQDYVAEMFEKNGFNPSSFDMLYFPVDNTSTGFGQGVVKFVPNKSFPAGVKIPEFEPIVVRPDASIKNQNLRSNAAYVLRNASDPEAINWANEANVMSLYGDKFTPLFNNIANGVKLGDNQELKDQRTVSGVRFGDKDYTMFLKPELTRATDDGDALDYNLYLDPISVKKNGANYPTDKPVATGKSLPEAISNLYSQHLKVNPATSSIDTADYDKEGIGSFLKAIGNRESGNNPTIINDEGYIGKYQFGQAALNDTGFNNINKNNFKENPTLWPEEDQDTAMIKLMSRNEKALSDVISKYTVAPVSGKTITKSGILAAAHIGGAEGVRKYFESNGTYNPADSNGTTIEDYLLTFSGYKL